METTRELFCEMVGEAQVELGHRPTARAAGYLVDLLDSRVRFDSDLEEPATLAEALVAAQLVDGSARAARLRALGDRALFDAGFFGASLRRKTVGLEYFAQIGTTAYLRLSSGTGSDLFEELGVRFTVFVELLADVAERARGSGSIDLLGLYDQYRETGSPRDRARLIRHGMIVPAPRGQERPQ
ncbi:MAG: hypothetical protein VX466_02765 [Myxococcota bacterium]|nr:hypothetical protein [Myxococcota bacterium]